MRAKIFPSPASPSEYPEKSRGSGWGQARLAFASVMGLALIIAFRQNPPAVPSSGYASQAMLAAAMSNQDFATYVSPRDISERNLPSSGFECTNMRFLRLSPGDPGVAPGLLR